jgi:DNA-binding response OmpR family regulator
MKQHILVVDDEAPIRNLLTTYFQKRGYRVTSVATAEEARRCADETPLNLIILDIDLSDADGLDLLAMFRKAYPQLPIIMLTGMGYDDELLEEALRKGATGYVSKTLPLDQLLMEVHRALKQQPSPV